MVTRANNVNWVCPLFNRITLSYGLSNSVKYPRSSHSFHWHPVHLWHRMLNIHMQSNGHSHIISHITSWIGRHYLYWDYEESIISPLYALLSWWGKDFYWWSYLHMLLQQGRARTHTHHTYTHARAARTPHTHTILNLWLSRDLVPRFIYIINLSAGSRSSL